MASEIRVNTINNRSGLGTVSVTDTGLVVSGIITATTVNTSSTSTFSSGLNVTGGDVGIGTNTPASAIDISGTAAEVRFYRDTRDRYGSIQYTGSKFQIKQPTSDHLTIVNSSDTEFVRVTNAGDVGIGTDNPGTRLEISAPTSAGAISNALSLTQAGTGSGTGTRLLIGYDTAIGTYGSIEGFYDGTGTSLTFGTSDNAGISAVTERVRIDGSGNVGIGTDNPQAKLDVNGDVNVAAGGSVFIGNGNLVFSTSGTGIDFSATSDASGKTSELLDDYEEGTWTPTGTSDLDSFSSAYYIKVGRLVTITCRLDFLTNSSTTITAIGGLPFTPDSNLSNSAMGNSVGETTYTSTDRPFACIEVSGVIRFRINGNTNMTYANWSGKSVRMSLTYFSNS